MRGKRLSIGVSAALAIFTAGLLVTSARAVTPEEVLHSFGNGTDGYAPAAGLVFDTAGNLYSTTPQGGSGAYKNSSFAGTVFELTPTASGGWTEQVLYSFCSQINCTDGAGPKAGLIFDAAGNLYGTTDSGGIGSNCGSDGCGTVFELTPTAGGGWTEQVLYSFNCNGTDGCGGVAGLIFDAAGNLYSTTPGGGTYGGGTVFELTPQAGGGWTEHVLYNFGNGTDGAGPSAGLIFDAAGNLYGPTAAGGTGTCVPYGCGTVFELTPAAGGGWTEKVLHSFSCNGTDGCYPSGLIFDAAGNLYGTTAGGGIYNSCDGSGDFTCGTVFELKPAAGGTWTEQVLLNFDGTDGASPSGLIFDALGNLYGTTYKGGAGSDCAFLNVGCGTVFELTPTAGGGWTENVLHSFNNNGTDGALPSSGLIFDAAGNLYGETATGGTYHSCFGGFGCGTVFEVTPPNPLQFVPATPCRVVDTREADGTFGGPAIQGGSYRSFPLPQGSCNLPTSAAAYSLNVTVVPIGQLGYLTIWPSGQAQPVVSTMNSLDGRIKANAAIVPAGTLGGVSVYVSNTTNVVLDIDGYFPAPSGLAAPAGAKLDFYPLTPCRVLDTRNANGSLGGPYLSSGEERDFPVLESDCNIPSTARAYSMNFTVVPYEGQSLGYLTVWGQGGSRPVVSTLNNLTATIVANAAIVPAGTGGGIAVYPSGNTQLVADIDGYFAAAGTGGLSLYTLTPCRVIDTRKGSGQFSGELTVDVVDSACAPPNTAQAYVFNATVVPVGGLGYLTLWPDTEQQPKVSTLNAIDGAITSNMAIVPNINGKTNAYASGITQLILDISSYFAP